MAYAIFSTYCRRKTGEVKKYESLIRIVKPDGDELSPFMFLDVAKATRLYPHITRAVILKSFEIFKNRKESFSINISIEDILDSETSSFVINTLADYNLGNRVIFEILESEGIENYMKRRLNFCTMSKIWAQK